MRMTKHMRTGAMIALVAAGLAACGESPLAPVSAPQELSPDGAEALLAKGGGSGSGSSNSGRGQHDGSRTFTVYPGMPVFEKFGDHVLTMPANVVCDPVKSGYGSAYWDEPCGRATRPLKVTATWSVRGGRPVISFTPSLRFAPSKNEQHWVNLSLRNPKGIDPDLYYAILWYDAAERKWVDESQTDPTLKARTSQAGNLVTRRLKHFSDYGLWFGVGSYNVTSGWGGDLWGGW